MISNSPPFCDVCEEEIIRKIYNRVDPIDSQTPKDKIVTMGQGSNQEFTVETVMKNHP